MSNPAVGQEEKEDTRLPTPRLDFTGRVRSILDGDDSILSPNTDIPSVPDEIVDMDVQNSIEETNQEGNVHDTAEEVGEEQSEGPNGGTAPIVNDQETGAFFGLEKDQQFQILLDYKNSLQRLSSQNKELTDILETVNQDRQTLKVQFQESINQNKKLLEELQKRPDVDSITKEVRESIHKEYDLKMDLIEENTKRDLAVKEALFKEKMDNQEKQYDILLNTALDKVKSKYESKMRDFTELQATKLQNQQDQFRAQLDALNQELEVWKHKASVLSNTSNIPGTNVPSGTKLGALKQDIFNYVPGTVNTNRGGAADNTTINWEEPLVRPKKVTFVTSTPLKFDSGEVTQKEMDGLAAPLTSECTIQNPSTTSSTNTTLVNIASEFKKMREPKLQKLKGGNTSSAHLFLTGWVKEVRATIKDRELTEAEGVQLIREFTESKARQQVDFYMDLNPTPTVEGVLDHLVAAFSTGEDESAIKSEFYSRKQLSRESEDDYAEVLQLLARKILLCNPGFQTECNNALVHQFANGIRDDIIRPLAKDLVSRKPDIQFVRFRAEVANLSGSRQKRSITKVSTNTIDDEVEESQPPKKGRSETSNIDSQIRALVEQNKTLSSKVDTLVQFQSSQLDVVTKAVGFQRQTNFPKPRPQNTESVNPTGKPKEGTPYLGKALPPKPTAGKNGQLNVTETCNYCKNPGHLIDNCGKLQDRIDQGKARPVHPSQKQSGK